MLRERRVANVSYKNNEGGVGGSGRYSGACRAIGSRRPSGTMFSSARRVEALVWDTLPLCLPWQGVEKECGHSEGWSGSGRAGAGGL